MKLKPALTQDDYIGLSEDYLSPVSDLPRMGSSWGVSERELDKLIEEVETIILDRLAADGWLAEDYPWEEEK